MARFLSSIVLVLAVFALNNNCICSQATDIQNQLSEDDAWLTDLSGGSDLSETVTNVDPNDDEDDDSIDGFEDVGEPIDFPIEDMTDEEIKLYANLEDQIFVCETDEHVAKKLLAEKAGLYSQTRPGEGKRRKRIAPLIARGAFAVGRALFRRFGRSGITRSGSRITRHYNGRGNYNSAVGDFNRLRPDNVQRFNGRISGQTGTIGRNRVTVRDGSSGNSRPTLEIRSHGGDLVRKFRYNN